MNPLVNLCLPFALNSRRLVHTSTPKDVDQGRCMEFVRGSIKEDGREMMNYHHNFKQNFFRIKLMQDNTLVQFEQLKRRSLLPWACVWVRVVE